MDSLIMNCQTKTGAKLLSSPSCTLSWGGTLLLSQSDRAEASSTFPSLPLSPPRLPSAPELQQGGLWPSTPAARTDGRTDRPTGPPVRPIHSATLSLRPPPAHPGPTWRGAAPHSPCRGLARPASPSPPPLGGRASRGSSPGPRGPPGSCDRGSPVSRPRPSGPAPPGALPSPPPRRLLGEAGCSAITPASNLRFRGSAGCEAPAGGVQSGGPSGRSRNGSRFQGTWNVSGAAARRLAMAQSAAEAAGAGAGRRRGARRAGGRGRAGENGASGRWSGRERGAARSDAARERRLHRRRRAGAARRLDSSREAAEIRTCARVCARALGPPQRCSADWWSLSGAFPSSLAAGSERPGGRREGLAGGARRRDFLGRVGNSCAPTFSVNV